jgi:alpha-beta hydrolase superfamily lysophospholipase
MKALAHIEKDRSERVSRVAFTVAVTVASRTLILRDKLLGKLKQTPLADADSQITSRHKIASGNEALDSVFVAPRSNQARAALLICHGIGETVAHWPAVQNLLASRGIASLVFDYAGYGSSTGRVDWQQCQDDAVAAFEFLKALAPGLPVSVLGFSMGTGIAGAVTNRIAPERLILCSSFTSFQAASHKLGVPRALSFLVPPIWNTLESIPHFRVPVLILHCEKDRVFPVQMATDLHSSAATSARFALIPNHKHNEAFYRPQLAFWNHVFSFLLGARVESHSHKCSDVQRR